MDNSILTDLHDELRKTKLELSEANDRASTLSYEKDDIQMKLEELKLQLEELKQENFSVNNELKRVIHQKENLESVNHEYSLVREENKTMRDECAKFIKKVQDDYRQQITELRNEVEENAKTIEDQKEIAKSLRQENESLLLRVENLQNSNNNHNASDRSISINHSNSSISGDSDLKYIELEQKLMEKDEMCDYLQQKMEKLERFNEELREEKEDLLRSNLKQCSIIEKMKNEADDLSAELDTLRLDDVNRQGNSLFAEVEDRRVEAQQQLKITQAQAKSLRAQVEREQNHSTNLKMQVCSLLKQSNNQIDKNLIKTLKEEIALLTREKRDLIFDKEKLEEKIASGNFTSSSGKLSSPGEDEPESKKWDYIAYLKQVINKKDVEIKKIKREFNQESLILTDEINKKVRAEVRVAELQKEKVDMRNTLMQKKLENESLTLRLGLKVKNMKPPVMKERIEKIRDSSDDEDEDEIENKNPLQESNKSPVNQKQVEKTKIVEKTVDPESEDEIEKACKQQ